MKKITLLAAGALMMTGTAYAGLEQTSNFYQENFEKMSEDNDRVSNGWISRGVDAAPISEINIQSYFGTYMGTTNDTPQFGEPYYPDMLLNDAGKSIAILNSCFPAGTVIDQWLISPEIEIPYEDAMFSFDYATYAGLSSWVATTSGAGYSAPFKVMISTTGTDSSDFQELYSSAPSVRFGTADNPITYTTFLVPLNGYKGKKVHLALKIDTPNIGLVGWTNLSLGQYAFSYDNSTALVAKDGEEVPIRVNVGMKTPLKTNGINVILEYQDQKIEKFYKKNFGGQNGKYTFQLMTFNDPMVKIVDNKTVDYKLTIIPEMLDADGDIYADVIPTILTGSIVCVQKFFPMNVVMEEATASGCGWCPRGIGAAQYYADVLAQKREELGNTEEEGPKFIPIMIHSYMNYADPMNVGVEAYVQNFASLNGSGLPMAQFGRSARSVDPSNVAAFKSVFNQQGIYDARIQYCYNMQGNEAVTYGDELKVNFTIEAGFTAETSNLAAAVVLVENDVRGDEKGYSQENYICSRPFSSIGVQGDIPEKYFSKFLQGGEWGMSLIPYSEMIYQEVARGIWPNYNGMKITGGYSINTPRQFQLAFKVPENVTNLTDDENLITDKFDLVILVLDNSNSQIIASDKMNLKKAIDKAGSVNAVAAEETIKVAREGNTIKVNAPASVAVNLYSIDGKLLGKYNAKDGSLNINASSLSGVVILKASTADSTLTRKLIF